ncbi:MAG: DUF4412 domain-containing protein [Bacteroidota bacterium]
MMKQLTLVLFFASCVFSAAYSQDFEGTILYEASYQNLTPEMKKMLPDQNPQSVFSFKGNKTKMEMEMMGMKMVVLSDLEKNTSISYTDVMGQKFKATTPIDDSDKVEITLVDGETKKIAGYLCKKAIMKQPEMPDVEVYYAEDLKSSAISSMLSQFGKLAGIPLEYQIQQQGITMTFSAKEVKRQSLSNSIFNPPAGEYKKAPAMPKY